MSESSHPHDIEEYSFVPKEWSPTVVEGQIAVLLRPSVNILAILRPTTTKMRSRTLAVIVHLRCSIPDDVDYLAGDGAGDSTNNHSSDSNVPAGDCFKVIV
jgi:hypothetical protein